MNKLIKQPIAFAEDQKLDLVFKALADKTRRAQLALLSEGKLTVSQLAEPFDMSLPAASKHLKILHKAGLIDCQKTGRVHECQIKAHSLDKLQNWLNHYRTFWQESLDDLAELVEVKND